MTVRIFSAPNSGQLIGTLVKAFRLHDPEIGGPISQDLNATVQKTAQRFFRGERVDHDTSAMLCRQFAAALFHSELFGSYEGTVEWNGTPVDWGSVFERAVVHNTTMWDREFLQAASLFPRADQRLSTLIFARQVVIELALRHACLVLMKRVEPPSDDVPWWGTPPCFGTFLRLRREGCSTPPSGSAIAAELRVNDRTVDRWFSGEEIPNVVHTDCLARLFAAQTPDGSEQAYLRDFRRAAGIASAVKWLCQLVGQRAIEGLSTHYTQFVGWTLNLAAENASTDSEALSIFAEILVYGTAHSANGPVLIDWASRVRTIPWMDDIMKSHPVDRYRRLVESLRIVGEAEKRQADLEEVMPHKSQDIREMLSEVVAWQAIATPTLSTKAIQGLSDGSYKAYRIPAATPAIAAANRMQQADQAAAGGDHDTACVHSARAVHLQPERADYRFFHGCYLWQVRRYSEAIEHLEIACKLKPEWDRPFVEIAIVHANRGFHDMAVFHLEQAPPGMRDTSDWLQFTLGKLYRTARDFEKALECFEASIALNSDNGEAFDFAADCAFRLGKHPTGIRYAKEAKHRGVHASFRQWQDGGYPKLP